MITFIRKLLAATFLFIVISSATAQTQLSPKYSVDGTITALTTYGDTLITGGSFNNVGVYTGGGALFTTGSDQPNLAFPKIIGNIKASTPDGAGGFYVYGDFRKEALNLNTFFPPRIEHIRADFTFDTAFSLPVNALFGVNTILYNNGLLYIGGSYMNTINGQAAGDLSIINVATKQFVSWTPAITITYLGGVSNMYITQNTLYIMGGFTAAGGQARQNIAAIELYTGAVKPWNFAAKFTNAQHYSDIRSYKNKVIVSGDFYIGSTPQDIQHACALIDTTAGTSVEYIFKAGGLFGNGLGYLYFAATVSSIAVSGDTLYTFSGGTYDTRVTAINLADSNRAIWGRYFNIIASAVKMEVTGGSLFVAGTNFTDIYAAGFTNDDPIHIERKVRGALKLNTATGALQNWYPDPTSGSSVLTMSLAGSNVFIGGNFTQVKSLERTGIVMLKASTQEVLPFSINLYGHTIRDFKIADTTLYAAGGYYYINGVNNPKSVIAFSLRTGAQTAWNPPYLGTAFSIEVNSQNVFIGGDLNEPSGGMGRTNLFAINRQSGALAAWAPNPNAGVSALHLSEGRLYVGGGFTNIAGTPRNYLAAFDTITTNLAAWNPSPNWNVNTIKSSYGIIWIGGMFYDIGGITCGHFAGIKANSGALVHKPIANYRGGSVNAITVKGCSVMFGSSIRVNDTITCNDVHVYDMYNKTLVPASSFCVNVDDLGGAVYALTTLGNDLYFGGNFTKVNNKANAPNIERIRFPAGYFDGCAEYVSTQNGNWHLPATWLTGKVPPDDARIRVRHNVNVPSAANCFSLQVETGGALNVNNGVQVKVLN